MVVGGREEGGVESGRVQLTGGCICCTRQTNNILWDPSTYYYEEEYASRYSKKSRKFERL